MEGRGGVTGIVYTIEPDLSVEAFVSVLRRSGLAARRPVDQPARIAAMLEHASLLVCARLGDDKEVGLLVGVARSLTDFAYCCYCSELAVDRAYQGRGIGKELIRRSREAAGDGATFLLLSAPDSMAYYPRVGLKRFDNCFGVRRRR